MDATAVAPVQRMQLSRFAAHTGWELTDMAVDSTRVAVSGYNKDTDTTSIDLFTLDVSDSTPLQHQRPIFSREFPPVGDSIWRPYVSLIDGDSSHIVTVSGSQLDLYNIHSNDDHRTVTYREGEARCVAVSETGDIYIGLYLSNKVIVFDGELNIIKSINLNGIEGEWPVDITVTKNNLFISTDRRRAQRYKMDGELLNRYNKPDQNRSQALSIAVSSEAGLVFVLWGWFGSHRPVVAVFSLADGHYLFSFDVDDNYLLLWRRIRLSSNINRLIATTDEGELRVYNATSIFTFSNLKKELSSRLTEHDSMELGKYFQIPLDQPKRSSNSKSTAENFLLTLEERGLVHHSNVNRLTEALTKLKIKCSLVTVTYMKLRASQETDYDRFLAGLSAHLTLSTPEKLCDHFKFSEEERRDITTSQNPGLSLLLTLDEMGFISASDVSELEAPLADNHLLQAVAKIHEYQSLIAESNTAQTDLSDEDKRKLFIKCLQQKTKSWFESMTPVPWKKSCQWKSSDLFVASGLVLTSSVSKTSARDVDAKSKLHYQDIFTDERLKGKTRIILEGQPGCGKTMLSSQVAYDWSCGRIQDVPVVIYLPLKLVEDKTIVQAIKMFYIQKDVTILEDDIESILANKMDVKIWLILDGLEEYNGRPKEGELSEVMKVMMKEKLPKCNVILTARSDYVKDLPPTPMLKIGSFGEDERNEYIEKIYSDDIERQEAVKGVMDKIPCIAELCTVPLLFVLSVHNIDSLAELEEQQQNRVTPFVKTIVDVLCPLAEKYDSGSGSHSDSEDEKYDSGGSRQSVSDDLYFSDLESYDSDNLYHSKPLYTLEELAFNGLCRGTQQLMWQKDFVVQNVVNSKEWMDSGILVVEEGSPSYFGGESPQSDKRSESTEPGSTGEPDVIAKQQEGINLTSDEIQKADQSASVTDERFTVTESESKTSEKRTSHQTAGSSAKFVPLQVKFLHKLIQEWFASKHLARLFWRSSENSYQYQLFREHLATINPADLHYVLRFTCHICPPSFHFITSYLMREFKTNDGQIPDYIINCICLCFSEYVDYHGNKVKDIVTEMCQAEVISINSDDSLLLLRAKVSMITFASKSKIPLKGLKLTNVVESVADKTLVLKFDVFLDVLDTLEYLEVSRWDQKLQTKDYEDFIKFIANSKCIKTARLLFPSPPEIVKDEKALQDLKSRNASIEWIIGARLIHQLSLESGTWPMEFRLGGRSTNLPLALEHVQDEDRKQKESEEEIKDGVKLPDERYVTDVKDDLRMKDSFVPDVFRSELTVGEDGGLLEIPGTGVSLEIPAGALETESLIQLRIITDHLQVDSEFSFSSNSSTVVELLPNDIKLKKEAKLTLPHCLVLKKGYPWTATIYSSHHEKGTLPLWKAEPAAVYELKERSCVIWLKRFSWETFEVRGKIVEGKHIVVYAAKHLLSSNTITHIHVGYCWELPELIKKITTMNPVEIMMKQSTIFYKEGYLPLHVLFEKVEPPIWRICNNAKGNPKDVDFDKVANTYCHFEIFVLDKEGIHKSGRSTFHIKAWQTNSLPTDLSFLFEDPSTQSSDSPGPPSAAATAAFRGHSSTSYQFSAHQKYLDNVVEDKILQIVSAEITRVWKSVGRSLLLRECDVTNIGRDYDGVKETSYQMLLTWKQRNGAYATYRTLGDALQECGRTDLKEVLYEQGRAAECSWSTEGRRQKSRRRRKPYHYHRRHHRRTKEEH